MAAGFAVALWLDRPVYRVFADWSLQKSWEWMFRTAGFLPFWLLVAVVLFLVDHRRLAGEPLRRITRRAELILWSTVLSGIAANILKIVLRRERPEYHDGEYVFRELSDGLWQGEGLALPSGDLAVAGAAAFVLTRLYPVTTPVWLIMVLGCVLSRLAEGDHFLSDVYLGTVVGCLVGLLVWRLNLGTMRRLETADRA